MKGDPSFVLCGVLCLWPLLWASIAFWIGRYRPRFQSPIKVAPKYVDRTGPTARPIQRPVSRPAEERISK